MNLFTVQNLQADVSRKIHGQVSESFFGSVNEAARWLLGAIDPYETKRIAYLESALYDQISKYYLPVDVKDNRIIDIRKQQQTLLARTYRDDFTQISNRSFDKYNSTGSGVGAWRTFTMESLEGVKFIRINDNLPNTALTLQTCDNLSNNGTWNIYGSVNTLTVDALNFLTGQGALQFNVDSGTFGALENADIQQIDLTDYVQTGAIFTWIFLPTPSVMSSVRLFWGSSALDYYNFTVTAPHNNTVWVQGWNLMKFPLQNPIVVGDPLIGAINRVRLEFTTTGVASTGIHIENIVAHKGTVYIMEYYSDYLFNTPMTGLWQPQTYDLGDNINLSTTSYNILMLKTALIEAQEVRNSATDVAVINADLQDVMHNYLASNKSEYIVPEEAWYKEIDPTRNQFFIGGNW